VEQYVDNIARWGSIAPAIGVVCAVVCEGAREGISSKRALTQRNRKEAWLIAEILTQKTKDWDSQVAELFGLGNCGQTLSPLK
jgi:hypothetical protein